MRPNALACLKMFSVHQKSDKIVAVQIQPEQYSAADVIDSAFHRTVHCLCMICVVAFGTCRMQSFIGFFVVGFLKENVGSDSGIMEFSVIFNCRCRDVYIDSADGTVFVFYAVDGLDAFKNIFDRVVYRIFPGFKGKTFVSHVLERNYLTDDFFLCKLFAWNVSVLDVVRTVCAAVDAVVGKIKWRK